MWGWREARKSWPNCGIWWGSRRSLLRCPCSHVCPDTTSLRKTVTVSPADRPFNVSACERNRELCGDSPAPIGPSTTSVIPNVYRRLVLAPLAPWGKGTGVLPMRSCDECGEAISGRLTLQALCLLCPKSGFVSLVITWSRVTAIRATALLRGPTKPYSRGSSHGLLRDDYLSACRRRPHRLGSDDRNKGLA